MLSIFEKAIGKLMSEIQNKTNALFLDSGFEVCDGIHDVGWRVR
jgi:hypothetical protein